MQRYITLLISLICLVSGLQAQEFQEITSGAGYARQSFVDLTSGTEKTIENEAYDLAFTVYDGFNVGIFINESSGIDPVKNPSLNFYDVHQTDFSAVPNKDSLNSWEIYNDEQSWQSGALNLAADPKNPFDFGWGDYNPANHQIIGKRIFAVKLRNGEYKKFKIESFINGAYTIRWANLDNSGDETLTFKTSDFAGNKFAYFNFATGKISSLEPDGSFDLWYTRYKTPLDAGGGQILIYNVLGLLSAPGVEVAQANEINPATVALINYADSFSIQPDVIGHDWKYFTDNVYKILTNRAYFVKSISGTVYKIVFIDFEGATSGTSVFQKTDLGVISAVSKNNLISEFSVFPNPAQSEINLLFTPTENILQNSAIKVFDNGGKLILNQPLNISQGLNAVTLNVSSLLPGVYTVVISSRNEMYSQQVIINK